jgi:hypothetical protein
MGQKSNITTLRKSETFLSLYRSNKTEFLYGYIFLIFLEKLFKIRRIFLTNSILNFVENKIYINLTIFFRVSKILYFKKIKHVYFKKKKQKIFLFFQHFKKIKKNLIVFNFKNINILLKNKKKSVYMFFRYFKRFALSLFPRRFNFFLDFVKLSLLFAQNNISLKFFIQIFTEMFRILQKQKHSRFLFFIKNFFDFLINSTYCKNNKDLCNIKGIKFILSGKIKGKARSSHYNIVLGQIPIQSLNKNIEFSKAHAFTVYGVFGLKFWVYRSFLN